MAPSPPADVAVRPAAVSELPDVCNVLDGGALEADAGRIRTAIDREDVLVAVVGSDGNRILGACVLDGDRITHVAVRPRRRGQGIGTSLVEAAADRRDHLVAEFDEGVRSFWTSLGFDARPLAESGRYRGTADDLK